MTTPSTTMRGTCSFITSAQGEPIAYCGQQAISGVFITSAVTGKENCGFLACGAEHLAAELRLIALYEVCDFRIVRYLHKPGTCTACGGSMYLWGRRGGLCEYGHPVDQTPRAATL